MALGVMRRHRRWLYAFLWIVILGFIVFYIPAFRSGVDAGSPAETLATVGDRQITVGEFQKAYLRQRAFYERMYQGRANAALLKRMGLDDQVFEGLVADRLVDLETRRLGLNVDDESVARSLATSPEFQENGRFMGSAEIKRRLDLEGVSVEDFEHGLRQRLLRDQLETLVTSAVSVSPAEVEREFRRRTEQVKLEYVLVEAVPFRAQIAPGEEEVKARFEKDRDRYRIPEQRVLDYVLVDQAALRARAVVTERDLETYYQAHRDEFKQDEQVCASHILIKVRSAPELKQDHLEPEARKLAEELLARLKAGADFAELAKKSSEDKGSAERGGDLGCFPRGAMVPEFEQAAFSLEPGQTSPLVKSGFGYHIIRVGARNEESIPPFDAVKERIRPVVTGEKLQELASEQVGLALAALKRGKLEDAARAISATVQTSAPMAIGTPVEPLSSPALSARAFAMKPGETERDAFKVARGYAVCRLRAIQPARPAEFAEVAAKVKTDLVEEKALEMARRQAAELLARARQSDLEKGAAALKLVRKETPQLTGRGQPLGELGSGSMVEEAAFGLPEKTLSDPVRAGSGYAILRVLERKGFDAGAFGEQKQTIEASLLQEKKSQLFQAYMNQARDRYAVERRPDVMKRIVG